MYLATIYSAQEFWVGNIMNVFERSLVCSPRLWLSVTWCFRYLICWFGAQEHFLLLSILKTVALLNIFVETMTFFSRILWLTKTTGICMFFCNNYCHFLANACLLNRSNDFFIKMNNIWPQTFEWQYKWQKLSQNVVQLKLKIPWGQNIVKCIWP